MKYLLFFSLFIGLFFLSRSSHAQFRSSLHMPTFSNSGEMEIKLTYYNRPEGHLAFAFSPKWHTNLFFASEFPKKTSRPVYKTLDKATQNGTYYHTTNAKLFQGGFGYRVKRKKNRVFEFSFGVGKGNTHVVNEIIYTDSTTNTYKEIFNYRPAYFLYFQPSIGRRGETFGWAFAFKASTYSLTQPALVTTFLEPVYSFNYGKKNLRFDGQLGFALGTNPKFIHYRILTWSIGLSYRLKVWDRNKARTTL